MVWRLIDEVTFTPGDCWSPDLLPLGSSVSFDIHAQQNPLENSMHRGLEVEIPGKRRCLCDCSQDLSTQEEEFRLHQELQAKDDQQ